MKQYIVDAFTNTPFTGNPAAVCVMEDWPSEESMMKLAMENNLSETAFVVKEEDGYRLRWFTPETEVELCGHATLASAYVILNCYESESMIVLFRTLSGVLTVKRIGDRYEMDLPTYELKEIPVTDDMERAFGIRPVKAMLGLDLVCVFETEDQVRNMTPDQNLLMRIEGRIQNATARGKDTDCVSRSFCPKLGIAEDPVCGAAHCQIADYWAWELGKTEILAYQASKRGGYLRCERKGNGRIAISGEAALVAVSEIKAEPWHFIKPRKGKNSKELTHNKQLVIGLFKEFFNDHDISAAERYLHPDYIQHDYDVPPGVEGFKEHFTRVFEIFPHFHVEIKHLIEEGNMIVMHGYGQTDPGRIEVLVVDTYRVRDGLLYEHWGTVQPLPQEQFGNPAIM